MILILLRRRVVSCNSFWLRVRHRTPCSLRHRTRPPEAEEAVEEAKKKAEAWRRDPAGQDPFGALRDEKGVLGSPVDQDKSA